MEYGDDEYDDEYANSDDHIMALVNLAASNTLEEYWKRGKGAIKIRWGTPGDWTRCERHISKHVAPEMAKRICSQWHKDMTGVWPGDKRNP